MHRDCLNCVSLQRRLESMAVDLENLQVELHVKRRRISMLEREIQREREAAVSEPILDALFRYWHLICKRGNRAVKFGKKRREALVDRLREGFAPIQIADAINGAKEAAFEKNGTRYDDLELICRDELHVERFIKRHENYAEYQRQRDEAGLPHHHDPDLNDAEIDRQLEADRIYVWLQHESRNGDETDEP